METKGYSAKLFANVVTTEEYPSLGMVTKGYSANVSQMVTTVPEL